MEKDQQKLPEITLTHREEPGTQKEADIKDETPVEAREGKVVVNLASKLNC